MSTLKRGNRWYYRKRIKRPDGVSVRIFGRPIDFGLSNTKMGAQEAERRAIAKLHTPVAIDTPTLAAFQSVFLEHSEAKNEYSTVKAKRQILRDHLVPAFGPSPLGTITYPRIEDFKHALKRKDLSNKTGNYPSRLIYLCGHNTR